MNSCPPAPLQIISQAAGKHHQQHHNRRHRSYNNNLHLRDIPHHLAPPFLHPHWEVSHTTHALKFRTQDLQIDPFKQYPFIQVLQLWGLLQFPQLLRQLQQSPESKQYPDLHYWQVVLDWHFWQPKGHAPHVELGRRQQLWTHMSQERGVVHLTQPRMEVQLVWQRERGARRTKRVIIITIIEWGMGCCQYQCISLYDSIILILFGSQWPFQPYNLILYPQRHL